MLLKDNSKSRNTSFYVFLICCILQEEVNGRLETRKTVKLLHEWDIIIEGVLSEQLDFPTQEVQIYGN